MPRRHDALDYSYCNSPNAPTLRRTVLFCPVRARTSSKRYVRSRGFPACPTVLEADQPVSLLLLLAFVLFQNTTKMTGGYVNNCTFTLVPASLYEVLTNQKLKPYHVEMKYVEMNKADSPFILHQLPRFLEPAQPRSESSAPVEDKISVKVTESTYVSKYRVDTGASLESLCGAFTSAAALVDKKDLYEKVAVASTEIDKLSRQLAPLKVKEEALADGATLPKKERTELKRLKKELKAEE